MGTTPGKILNKSDQLLGLLVTSASLPFVLFFCLIYKYPLPLFSFTIPLFTVLLFDQGLRLWQIPPLIIVSTIFFFIGIMRVFIAHKKIQYFDKSIILMFLGVLLFEVLVFFYHDNLDGFDSLLGRFGFLFIAISVAINVDDINTIRQSLYAFVIAVSILGVLTILHATGIYSLPIAMDPLARRTFFGFRFPYARTLGIAMSYGKFGIMTSAALSITIISSLGHAIIIPRRSISLILAVPIIMSVLLSQGRAVYITVFVAIIFSLLITIFLVRNPLRNLSMKGRRNWLLIIVLLVILAVAVSSFQPSLASLGVFDVETYRSTDNAVGRTLINMAALNAISSNPFLGVGHGSIQQAFLYGSGIHNHFLEQFVATGLIGGIFYLIFYFILLLRCWTILKESDDDTTNTIAGILFISLIAVFLEYQFFPGFLVEAVAWLFGIILVFNSVRPNCINDGN